MSREYVLITPRRPSALAFVRTVAEAAAEQVEVDGDFEDVDDYLHVSAPNLWMEVEPPGYVEAVDLEEMHPDVQLPQSDDEGCLWLTVANVPSASPPASGNIAWLTFRRLAEDYDGVTIGP